MIGTQKGNLNGEDVIFADQSFIKHTLRVNDSFYREALNAISKLEIRKHIPELKNEPVFYNPIFTTKHGEEYKTIKPFSGNNRLSKIKTYQDLLDAENTEKLSLKAAITQKIKSIQHIANSEPTNKIIGILEEEMDFSNITQKFIYEQLIHQQSRDHVYQTKWQTEMKGFGPIDWNNIWESLHQQFFTEETKSTIWEQIHLNFFTTYNYNTWHNSLHPCPLCNKIPEDIFHIILDCKFTIKMWKNLEKTLLKIMPTRVTKHEQAFGLQLGKEKEHNLITLRNWLTFTLRHFIMLEERKAFYRKNNDKQEQVITFKYRCHIREEAATKELFYKYAGRERYFEKIITAKRVVANKNENGSYSVSNVM